MATTEEIRLVVKEELSKATKNLKGFNKELGKSEKQSKKNEKSMASMVKRFVGFAVVLKGLKTAIMAASRLEEARSKFYTVFSKEVIPAATKSLNELTEAYAMSEREATQYMSSMQDLLVPMGVGEKRAADMSGAIVKLSADLGSFNDMPTETVMNAIQSAMAGNFETMKRYGSMLNEARVKQEAFNLGLYDGKGTIDAASKAQAAFSLIVKDSSNAIGDMKATQDSFANTLKRIKSGLEDGAAAAGNEMLPAIKDLGAAIFDTNTDGIGFKEVLQGVGIVIKKVIQSVTLLVRGIQLIKSVSDSGKKKLDILAESSRKFGADTHKAGNLSVLSLDSLRSKLVEFEKSGQTSMANAAKAAIDYKERSVNSNKDIGSSLKKLETSWQKLTSTYKEDADAAKKRAAELSAIRIKEREEMARIASEVEENKSAQREKENAANAKQREKELEEKRKYVERTTALERKVTDFNKNNLKIRVNDYNKFSGFMMAGLDKNSKAQFALYKAFAIQQAIMDTYAAANAAMRALSGIPFIGPGLGIAAASLAVAVGIQRVNQIRKMKAEHGAYLPGSQQGVDLTAGERGKSELVLPLEDEQGVEKFKDAFGGSGQGVNVTFQGCFFATEDWPREAAEKIDRELYKLLQDENSTFGESLR